MSRNRHQDELQDWQVAPAEFEHANYDEHKIYYRRYVEQMIKAIPLKTLKKRPFFTISTNVLCADTASSKADIEPIDRDIYLPLEISIVKWSLADGKQVCEERSLSIKHWMINPGEPTRGNICRAKEHRVKHKIHFDPSEDSQKNSFIEDDYDKIMKEINSYLTSDRTVFSTSIKYCRQDLGSLKWLNKQTQYKYKPITVLNIQDLYVVLVRHLSTDDQTSVGQGLARHRFRASLDVYDPGQQCDYHRTIANNDDDQCRFCTRAIALSNSNVIVNDVVLFTGLFDESS